jgi:thiamine-monophosphate kinase
MREGEFIEWIKAQWSADPRAVPVGPGDDCAVVAFGDQPLVVTTDQVLDGVHVVVAACGPAAAGRKAMARGLSDIAAMAAVPLAAVATAALPKGTPRAHAEAIHRGLTEAGQAFRCPLVGGDVGSWSGPLAISVTAFGRPAGAQPVCRRGARPGDALCVTGRLGGAWKSDRHLRFSPRISEAIALAAHYALHAMIDISDGLAADLGHLCAASGVGAEVLAAEVPVHPDADGLAAALGDGEDYELLFALPAEQGDAVARESALPVTVSRIGTVTERAEVVLVHPDGRRRPLGAAGWEHRT